MRLKRGVDQQAKTRQWGCRGSPIRGRVPGHRQMQPFFSTQCVSKMLTRSGTMAAEPVARYSEDDDKVKEQKTRRMGNIYA